MFKSPFLLLMVVVLYSAPGFSADQNAPKVFSTIVPDDNQAIREHMGKHLYRLFDAINAKISQLESEKELTREDFAQLYEDLTEMRAHFVAVLAKVPRKINDLEPMAKAQMYRHYQKYLAQAILYTINLEEAIGMEAATEGQVKKRNETLVKLVGQLSILVGRAHAKFRD